MKFKLGDFLVQYICKHLSNIIEREKSPMKYICDICNKEYSVRSSLWYHSKKCKASLIIEQQNLRLNHKNLRLNKKISTPWI